MKRPVALIWAHAAVGVPWFNQIQRSPAISCWAHAVFAIVFGHSAHPHLKHLTCSRSALPVGGHPGADDRLHLLHGHGEEATPRSGRRRPCGSRSGTRTPANRRSSRSRASRPTPSAGPPRRGSPCEPGAGSDGARRGGSSLRGPPELCAWALATGNVAATSASISAPNNEGTHGRSWRQARKVRNRRNPRAPAVSRDGRYGEPRREVNPEPVFLSSFSLSETPRPATGRSGGREGRDRAFHHGFSVGRADADRGGALPRQGRVQADVEVALDTDEGAERGASPVPTSSSQTA